MPESNTTTRYRLNEPLVASQEIEGETILIHFDSGHYFCANPAGSMIIAQLCGGAGMQSVGASLQARFAVEAAEAMASTQRFIGELLAAGLMVPSDESPIDTPSPAVNSNRLAFEAPTLQKFDDLQDLLMLDPIHDVDQAGWPMPAPSTATPDR